jgi:hypothetical protein
MSLVSVMGRVKAKAAQLLVPLEERASALPEQWAARGSGPAG